VGVADAARSPVSLTVHDLPPPADAARRTVGRLQMLLVVACCAAPVVASYITYFVIRPEGRNNYSDLIPARPLPEQLPLTRLSGETRPAASLKGQWIVAVVADGACDSRCQNNLLVQRQLRESLGREKDRVDRVWFVTDEAEPSEATLRGILAGEPTEVLRVPRSDLAQWLEPAPGHGLEDHLYVINPMGQWMMRAPPIPSPLSDPAPIGKFKKDVERLLRASSSWDTAGRP
jgi:hypothetical protein